MNDIVIIAPYKDLYQLCKRIIKERGYENIDVILGDLSEGVVEAKKAVAKGAKIIISRGGTYRMIKSSVNIPVVELRITAFDLLKGFKDLLDYKGKIGVVGFENVIYGCDKIGEILNLDIVKIQLNKDEEEVAEEVIKPYVEKGIKVFIGDTIGSRVSRKLNCKSYFITSGEDSVISAIKDAKRALMLSKAEQERAEKFKNVTDFVHDGIISIDEQGKITLINNIAKDMFELGNDAIGEPVTDILSNIDFHKVLESGKQELEELESYGTLKLATNKVPILVDGEIKGVVATFNDVTKLQQLERTIRAKLSKKGLVAKYHFKDIVYKSHVMEDCIIKAKKYSLYESPILITGKTGVGKELFAQSIHNYSKRKSGPFVAINCAAMPPSLIESVLFGYAEGAFTGAKKSGKAGLFELAHCGTIFLDEISELPLSLQGRLLRVLQEREVMRIGDDKVIPIDVRILCATNKDLMTLVEKGKFREDLFYRINILTLNIPSLNERPEDIKELIIHFIDKYSNKYNKAIHKVDDFVFEYLQNYHFKGNVRELEGIIERAVVLSSKGKLSISHFNLPRTKGNSNEKSSVDNGNFVVKEDLTLEELNLKYIDYMLKKYSGAVNKAAKVLGISRSTIWRKLNKNGS